MAEKEDLSAFDRMLSTNRSALDDLLVRGSTRQSAQSTRLPDEKPVLQSAAAGTTRARLSARSGDLSFSFRAS